MESDKRLGHSGLSSIPRESNQVAEYYDDWAAGYNASLSDWNYDAPAQVAALLNKGLSLESEILDAGCGTGLAGKALRAEGFTTIDGIDVSRRSLEVASTAAIYRSLEAMDMQSLPLPIEDDRYDGLACVGVFTYLTESSGTLKEFCRIVRPGGLIVITQRSDLFIERCFENVLNSLSDEGVLGDIRISEPRPYLPENEEFSDRILVHYIACTVL